MIFHPQSYQNLGPNDYDTSLVGLPAEPTRHYVDRIFTMVYSNVITSGSSLLGERQPTPSDADFFLYAVSVRPEVYNISGPSLTIASPVIYLRVGYDNGRWTSQVPQFFNTFGAAGAYRRCFTQHPRYPARRWIPLQITNPGAFDVGLVLAFEGVKRMYLKEGVTLL